MVSYEIQFNAEAAIAALRQFPGRTQRAGARALNRALTTGHAVMARELARDLGLRVTDAKDAIAPTKASPTQLEIRLRASLRRLPLSRFNPRQTRAGVSYKIGAGGRGSAPSAFLARMSSGHEGVFKRVGKTRLPIVELHGPSIGHVFDKHRQKGIDAMRDAFEKNLAHELDAFDAGHYDRA